MKRIDAMLDGLSVEDMMSGAWRNQIDTSNFPGYAMYKSDDIVMTGYSESMYCVLSALEAIEAGKMMERYATGTMYAWVNDYLRTGSDQSRTMSAAIYRAMGEEGSAPWTVYRGIRIWDDAERHHAVSIMANGRLEGIVSVTESEGIAMGFATSRKGILLEIHGAIRGVRVMSGTTHDRELEWVLNGLDYKFDRAIYLPEGTIKVTLLAQ